jgi:hypothetical protein
MTRAELIKYIECTWEQLKEDQVSTMLRVEGSTAPLFLHAREQTVGFLLTVDASRELDIKPKKYANVSIHIEKLSSETKGVVVSLTNQRFFDTFSKIAADVISCVQTLNKEPEYTSIYCLRVNSWRNIFSRGPQQMLSQDEQVGLFGELEFIQALINEGIPSGEVIDAWKGADAEDKDFQFHNVGIEVKSSHKQDKLVKISNIRQLDTTGFDAVYLYYYSFAKANGGSNTLPAQIDSVRSMLVGSPYLEEFESKLLNTGYSDADKENYKASYTQTYEEAYHVNVQFPKITKNMVMEAVLDASYVIDLNVCDDLVISYNSFMDKIKQA